MTHIARRILTILAVPVALAVSAVATAPAAAAANPTFPFDWKVTATTHLKKLDQTVTVPPGRFRGSVDLVTGNLTGSISLPPATTTVKLAGVGLATATFKIAQVKPVTGHVDFATLKTKATSVFDIKVVRASPVGLPTVNLVGDSCKTSTPVRVTMSGAASLTGSSTFRGTYTIPPLQQCGLSTAALNLVVPGPGNTFTAVASPR